MPNDILAPKSEHNKMIFHAKTIEKNSIVRYIFSKKWLINKLEAVMYILYFRSSFNDTFELRF